MALPPKRSGKYDWAGVAERARATPGEWVLFEKQLPRSTRGNLQQGRVAFLKNDPDYTYEACSRNTNGDRADIYVRANRR